MKTRPPMLNTSRAHDQPMRAADTESIAHFGPLAQYAAVFLLGHEMKIKHASIKAIRFIQANHDLPGSFDIADAIIYSEANIPIRVLEMPDGKLTIMIEISLYATEDAQRNAVKIARDWRRRLEEAQGKELDETEQQIDELRDEWSQMRYGGQLWKEIAASINDEIAARVKWLDSFRNCSPDDVPGTYSDVFFSLYKYLWAAGLRDKQSDEMIKTGFENIANGLPPFELGNPVDHRKLKQKVEYRRKKSRRKT